MALFNRIVKWSWKTSDRIDIWFKSKFNKDLKQRALELKMDISPNKRVNTAIDDALGLTNPNDHDQKRKDKTTNQPTKSLHGRRKSKRV